MVTTTTKVTKQIHSVDVEVLVICFCHVLPSLKAIMCCVLYISCLELDLLVIPQNTTDFEWWIHWRILTVLLGFWILQSFNLMVAVSHFPRLENTDTIAIYLCIAVFNQSSRQINLMRIQRYIIKRKKARMKIKDVLLHLSK